VPVSVATSKVENLAGGRVGSKTGPVAVSVTTPVACRARKVDWSEWFSPGVCPGGSPEAFPHHQPTVSGWIVADALGAIRSAPAITAAATRRLTFDLLSASVPRQLLPGGSRLETLPGRSCRARGLEARQVEGGSTPQSPRDGRLRGGCRRAIASGARRATASAVLFGREDRHLPLAGQVLEGVGVEQRPWSSPR
jgi:hypothetical protein